MNPIIEHQFLQTRRQFFGDAGLRLGGIALAQMLGSTASAAPTAAGRVHPPLPGFPHFKPRAKSLIYVHMNGGPSQLDMWDYKPELQKRFHEELPKSVRGEQRITGMTSRQSKLPVAPSLFKFAQHGN